MIDDMEAWAEGEARRLLRETGNRWLHVEGVARAAHVVRSVLEEPDQPVLVALAYLHDIGYAPELATSGVHQLDGARYLRHLGLERLACLVAHHSEARFELRLRGMEEQLSEYHREESLVADALTFCDLATGPTGSRMGPHDRLAEVEERYGEGLIVDALRLARPHLLAAVERVEKRLSASQVQAMTGFG